MERNLKEMIYLSLIAGGVYGIMSVGSSIIKEIKKLRKKLKFLKDFKNNENKISLNNNNLESGSESDSLCDAFSTYSEMRNVNHDDYVIIKGTSEKIYPRHGSLIDKNVIVSIGNSTYLEDFILKNDTSKISNISSKNLIEKYFIQPYPGTRMHNLKTQYFC